MTNQALRIVSFNVFLPAYQLVAGWAQQRGHEIVLVVASPAPRGDRYGGGHAELVAALPPSQDVLVTKRLRRTAAPVIAALAPDLIISATFPHRIPPEVTAIPRYGAVNLHPAPLPRGRGPNPQRLIYEGDDHVWASVHRIAPEFDGGAILSQRSLPLPDDLSGEAVLTAWAEMLAEALDEGVGRAVAGEVGDPQDEAQATYAAPFTDEERWVDWNVPARTIQRQVAALNVVGPTARAEIAGQPVIVANVRPASRARNGVRPGTVLATTSAGYRIAVDDGAVDVIVKS